MKIILCFILCSLANLAFCANTQVIYYRPFEQAYALSQTQGQCWTTSNTDARPDAYRCAAGNIIYDPCFVKHFVEKNQVVCPPSPWQKKAVLIHLTKPLPVHAHPQLDMSKAMPWAMELSDGSQCKIMTGATAMADGLRINYACSGGSYLVGEPHRCKAVWQVKFIQSKDDKLIKQKSVNKVWF